MTFGDLTQIARYGINARDVLDAVEASGGKQVGFNVSGAFHLLYDPDDLLCLLAEHVQITAEQGDRHIRADFAVYRAKV